MPFFLIVIGVILLVAVIKGNQCDLLNLVKSDFTGSNNFILWVTAVVIIVAIGNVKAIRPVSDAFLGLVILVIIVANYKNGNIFTNFTNQLKSGTSRTGNCAPSGNSASGLASSFDSLFSSSSSPLDSTTAADTLATQF